MFMIRMNIPGSRHHRIPNSGIMKIPMVWRWQCWQKNIVFFIIIVIVNSYQSLPIHHCSSPFITVHHHVSLPIIINHNSPPVITLDIILIISWVCIFSTQKTSIFITFSIHGTVVSSASSGMIQTSLMAAKTLSTTPMLASGAPSCSWKGSKSAGKIEVIIFFNWDIYHDIWWYMYMSIMSMLIHLCIYIYIHK